MSKTSDFHIDAGAAKSWKHCVRRAWYDVNPPPGLEIVEDRFETLINECGIAHEKRVLESFPPAVTATSVEHTQELMEQKTPVIYQPILVDKQRRIVGRPDFLVLTSAEEYQIADAKFANSLKDHPEIKIQLGVYRQLLGSELPALTYLGNGNTEEVADETSALTNKFLSSMATILANEQPPAAYFGDSKCKACPYDAVCRPQFIQNEELTLVYGIDSRTVPGLNAQGIHEVSDLAERDPETIADVPYLKGIEKKTRAVLQAKSYLTCEIIQFSPLELPQGTWVHFDVEVNPLSQPESNNVYIWGWLPPPYSKASFSYTWSDGTQEDDYQAWNEFLEALTQMRTAYPDLILAHFSPYEVTQIRAYAARYKMEEHPIVQWLLGDESPLFDMLPSIKNSLALPLVGYGLKAICKHKKLVNFQWELQESGSQWSVVRYLDYLSCFTANERTTIKSEIISYNRDDVRATRALEIWMRENYVT